MRSPLAQCSPDAMTAERRAGPRLRRFALPAIAAVLLAAMALDTQVVPIEQTHVDVFSAEAFGKKEFARIQAEIEQAAVDAKDLAAVIAADPAAAGEKHGKPGGVGPIFPIRFSGVVGEGNGGVFVVRIDGMPGTIGVRVQTGPAINGTEVRDATGTISFGQFTNQIEYQDAGAALNDEVKAQVLAGLERDALSGRTIEVVGVFQLINPANWLVTPVRLKVAP